MGSLWPQYANALAFPARGMNFRTTSAWLSYSIEGDDSAICVSYNFVSIWPPLLWSHHLNRNKTPSRRIPQSTTKGTNSAPACAEERCRHHKAGHSETRACMDGVANPISRPHDHSTSRVSSGEIGKPSSRKRHRHLR
jgi:hypothetical protein